MGENNDIDEMKGEPSTVISTQARKAFAEMDSESYAEAAQRLERLIGYLEANDYTEYSEYTDSLFNLADIYYCRLKELSAARTVYTQLHRYYSDAFNEGLSLSPDAQGKYLDLCRKLGQMHAEAGEFRQSIDVLTECLPRLKEMFAISKVAVACVYTDLSKAHKGNGDRQAAREALDTALADVIEQLGPGSEAEADLRKMLTELDGPAT